MTSYQRGIIKMPTAETRRTTQNGAKSTAQKRMRSKSTLMLFYRHRLRTHPLAIRQIHKTQRVHVHRPFEIDLLK